MPFYRILRPSLEKSREGLGPVGGQGCSAGIWRNRREGEGGVENRGAWRGCGAAGARSGNWL